MSTVHPLPPIYVWIEEKLTEESIREKFNDVYHKACRICDQHRLLIIAAVLCLCVGSVVVSVMIKSKTSIGNPCYRYTDNTLASDVTEECVTYLWNNAQCSTALTSNPTWKWWIQSPQGLATVKCDASHVGIQCGAGSYQTIRLSIPLCNSSVGR